MAVKPYVKERSKLNFHVPRTLEDDFRTFLSYDIPGAVKGFTVLHSWYDQFAQGYSPIIERGEIYPDSTKSRYSNVDNTGMNIRFAKDADIVKGDMVIDSQTKEIFLLDWQVGPSPNATNSRPVRCNLRTSFTRHIAQQVDEYGYLKGKERDIVVVDNLPINAYRYDGRPEFSASSSTVGVVPNALTIIMVQYNQQTKNIKIDDSFIWYNQEYVVIDINPVGLNIEGTSGILTLQAKKKAGGNIND